MLTASKNLDSHLVILGPMGVGKSTLGSALAQRLQRRYRDSDTDIVRLYGTSGRELADLFGVAHLHEIERAVLLGALDDPEPLVVSAAASVVENAAVGTALAARAFVVVLDAPADVIVARQAADESKHRRAMSEGELAALVERRAPMMAELADLTLDAQGEPSVLVDAVLSALPVS